MPLLLLAFFIVDLLSFVYPFIAYYLYRQWHKYHHTLNNDYTQRFFYGALALLLFILLGKFLVKTLLSKSRKGKDELHMFDTSRREVAWACLATMLPCIAVTTLIIAASKDRLMRPDAGSYMREKMPNAELVMLAPGNHQALLERHQEANEAALRFVQELDKN